MSKGVCLLFVIEVHACLGLCICCEERTVHMQVLFMQLLAASERVSSRWDGVRAGLLFLVQMCPGVACSVTPCSPDSP